MFRLPFLLTVVSSTFWDYSALADILRVGPTKYVRGRKMPEGEKDTRCYDLLIEYEEPDDADPLCLAEVVKEELPGNIFKFMLSEGLVKEEDEEDFKLDLQVEKVVVEEVDVVLDEEESSCVGADCTRTEPVEGCVDGNCRRKLPLQWDRTKTRRRRKRKNRLLLASTEATCTTGETCYPLENPDNSDSARMLAWEWGDFEKKDSSSEEEKSGSGSNEKDSEDEEVIPDNKDEEVIPDKEQSSIKKKSTGGTATSVNKEEGDEPKIKEETVDPENKEVVQTKLTFNTEGMRTIIEVLVDTINKLMQFFQEEMSLYFESEIGDRCSGVVAGIDFIYVAPDQK